MRKVYCDKCRKDFKPRPRKEKSGDVERVYLKCPKCKAEYTAYYTDSDIRAKEVRMRALQLNYNKEKDIKQKIKLHDMMLELKNEIGKDMDNLKAKMST